MATHDYVLEDDSGLNFRADLNNLALAFVTHSSSPTEPVNPIAGQWWVDTSVTPTLLKLRDSTNSVWTPIFDITNNEGIVAAEASDTSSINGDVRSFANTADTIAWNGSTLGVSSDIVGDISGYAGQVQGLNLPQILSLDGRTHKYLDGVTGGSSALYKLQGSIFNTQQATTGYKIMSRYTSAVTGTVRVAYEMFKHPQIAAGVFHVKKNGVAITSDVGVWDSSNPSWPGYRTLDATIAKGDTLSLHADLNAGTGVYKHWGHFFILTSEYGLFHTGTTFA